MAFRIQFNFVDVYLCAFLLSDIIKQRIIRMKVKSSQDANDPAVKAAILKKV